MVGHDAISASPVAGSMAAGVVVIEGVLVFIDRVRVSSHTTGPGAYALGAASRGFQSFARVGDGNSCYYCAEEVDALGNPAGAWEIGKGTYSSAGPTLGRTKILSNSDGTTKAISWTDGMKMVSCTVPAEVIQSLAE